MDKPGLLKKEEAILYSSQYDLPVTGEGGGEYTMPDYYPEIRRLVSVSAKALPDSKFLSGKLLEFGGTIAFSILYIGDDGGLVCVPYACEYSGNSQLPSEPQGGGAAIHVETVAEAPQCRVLAPRTVSLKTRLRTRIMGDEANVYTCRAIDTDGERIGTEDEGTLETLPGTLHTVKRGYAFATGSVSGELRERAGTKPISCDGTVNVTDATAQKDAVHVKGEICIHCLALAPDGLYTVLRGCIPFEEVMPAEGAKEGDAVTAWGRVASVSIQADEETGVIRTEAEYDLNGLWSRTAEVPVTQDIYSTEYDLEAKHSDYNVLSLLCCTNGALSLNGSGQRQSKAGANDYLIEICAQPVVEKVECADHKLLFCGNCNIKALIASDGDVVSEEFVIPIKYEQRAQEDVAPQDIVWQAVCSVSDASGRLEGDRIHASVELSIAANAAKKTQHSPVTEAIIDKYAKHDAEDSCIRICFPEAGQRVWEIAKRCGADGAEVERINKIQRDALCDGRPLIIK